MLVPLEEATEPVLCGPPGMVRMHAEGRRDACLPETLLGLPTGLAP